MKFSPHTIKNKNNTTILMILRGDIEKQVLFLIRLPILEYSNNWLDRKTERLLVMIT